MITDERFDQIANAERQYTTRVKAAGSFLDVPRVEHGAAQVPILYEKDVLDHANKEIKAAFDQFSAFASADLNDYLAEKKRRKTG